MRTRAVSLLMAGLIMTAGIHAQAQTPGDNGTAADRVHPLQLGPHTFAPMQNIPLPFVRTYLRTAIGLGQAWDISVPLLVIDTITILGLKGDLMFASLDFKYQHAVKDWMAVWAGVNIVGRLGTGVQSLLSEGVTAALGFELGTLFKLYESHRVSVAGTAKMINSDATVINVLNFVEGIVDSGRVVYPLVRNTPILSGDAGLRAAWSVSPFFGLYGKGTLGLTETEKAGEAARMYYNVGGVRISTCPRSALSRWGWLPATCKLTSPYKPNAPRSHARLSLPFRTGVDLTSASTWRRRGSGCPAR